MTCKCDQHVPILTWKDKRNELTGGRGSTWKFSTSWHLQMPTKYKLSFMIACISVSVDTYQVNDTIKTKHEDCLHLGIIVGLSFNHNFQNTSTCAHQSISKILHSSSKILKRNLIQHLPHPHCEIKCRGHNIWIYPSNSSTMTTNKDKGKEKTHEMRMKKIIP